MVEASARARWHGVAEVPKKCASVASPTRFVRPLRSRRASQTVSTTGAATRRPVSRSTARSRNPISKRALCATRVVSPAKSRNRRTARSAPGAPRRLACPMPVSAVIAGGSAVPGLTSVSNVVVSASRSTLWAPISTIFDRAGESPVVSRSNTTKEASSSRTSAPGGAANPTEAPRHASRASPETTSSRSERAIAVGAEASANSDRAASGAGTGPRCASTSSTSRSAASNDNCIGQILIEHTFYY